jgi:hypothetical protein
VTFRRVMTGEVKQNAYPAMFSPQEWAAANHHIASRRRGVLTGRNVTTYANLFGPLAVCGDCQGRMKIRGKN